MKTSAGRHWVYGAMGVPSSGVRVSLLRGYVLENRSRRWNIWKCSVGLGFGCRYREPVQWNMPVDVGGGWCIFKLNDCWMKVYGGVLVDLCRFADTGC